MKYVFFIDPVLVSTKPVSVTIVLFLL